MSSQEQNNNNNFGIAVTIQLFLFPDHIIGYGWLHGQMSSFTWSLLRAKEYLTSFLYFPWKSYLLSSIVDTIKIFITVAECKL